MPLTRDLRQQRSCSPAPRAQSSSSSHNHYENAYSQPQQPIRGQTGAEGRMLLTRDLHRQQPSSSPARVHSPPNSEYGVAYHPQLKDGNVYQQNEVEQPQEISYSGHPTCDSQSNFSPQHRSIYPPPSSSPIHQPIKEQPGAEGRMLLTRNLHRQHHSSSSAPRLHSPPYSEHGEVYHPEEIIDYVGNPSKNSQSNVLPFRQQVYVQPQCSPSRHPIIGQPGYGERIASPRELDPHGLGYLTAVDQLLVHQKMSRLAIAGIKEPNKYTIKNSRGEEIFYATEYSDHCSRQCCGPNRSFDMKFVDRVGKEVIHLYRPMICTCLCFPCWAQDMVVSAPPGNVIGSVQRLCSLGTKFSIKDESGETVLTIKGDVCLLALGRDINFNVFSEGKSKNIGKITKQWGGFVREVYTNADTFVINFPLGMNVKHKALLLAACLLIDYSYFDYQRRRR